MKRSHRKRTYGLIAAIVGALFLYTAISVFFAGGIDKWVWSGLPSPPALWDYVVDNYPGHGVECYQYEKMKRDLPKPDGKNPMTRENPLEITEGGLTFAGIRLRIGDTRADIRHKLRYGKWREDREEYYIGCMFCFGGFYNLDFTYDDERLVKIGIEYWEDF